MSRKANLPTITLEFPWVTPSSNQLIRSHWAARKREREKWMQAALEICPPGWEGGGKKVKITVFSYRPRCLDVENFIGGFKSMLDGFRDAGLIHDDNPKWLEHGPHWQEATRKKFGTIVILEILKANPGLKKED